MEKDKNTLVWIFIAVVAIIFLIGSFGMGGYGMMGNNMMGGMMGFGFIFMLLFWGVLIWLVITLINSAQSGKDDPSATMKKRYASGEISKKQFDEMKKELR